ncbi:hypothetical protein U0O11_09870 [Cobetia sp. D5]|nr:hypothetical protein [Cobetia sp. D5]
MQEARPIIGAGFLSFGGDSLVGDASDENQVIAHSPDVTVASASENSFV